MKISSSYRRKWAKRRLYKYIGIVIVCVAGLLFILCGSFYVSFGLVFLAVMFLNLFYFAFRCPRCGRSMNRGRRIDEWGLRCVHCGIREGEAAQRDSAGTNDQ